MVELLRDERKRESVDGVPVNASAPRVALLEFHQSFRTTIHLEEVESRESDNAFA